MLNPIMIEDMKIKRLICMLAVVVAAVSCEVVPSKVTPVDAEGLKDYSGQLFGHKVILPVEMAEFALDFDRYLSLPDDEQKTIYRFYGKVTKVAGKDDIYFVNDGRISCTVETGGKSLRDEDARWRYHGFSVTSYINAYRTPKMFMIAKDEVEIVLADLPDEAGEQCRVDITGNQIQASMIMRAYEEGMYEWQMACFGEDHGASGLRAEYTTGFGTGGMEMSERMLENGKYKEYICGGVFLVNIYDGVEEVDWVRMEFNPGYAPVYRTSR